ncbi:MAG: NAD(P)H-binding protein, partial [Thermoplasmata archaeon]|nr:NAD(P)H-binding protein [Thermoplasmata archaeon]NIY02830.1 NAD(P)H-binding protein [Thermoplasmata archaeon]
FALARSPEASGKLDGMGAHVVHGDLFDGEALTRLVKGSRHVFHVAGVNEVCSLHPEVMWSANVDGARAVLLASEKAGVERL